MKITCRTIIHSVKPASAQSFEPATLAAPFTCLSEAYDPWPALAVDAAGRVYISWAEMCPNNPTVSDVYLARGPSPGWNFASVDSNANLDLFAKTAMTRTGNTIYMVWRSATAQGAELVCTRIQAP